MLGIISIEMPGINIGTAALLCSDLTSVDDLWTWRCFWWRQMIWRRTSGCRLVSKHCIMWETYNFKRCSVDIRRWQKQVQHSKISELLVIKVSKHCLEPLHTLYSHWMVFIYVGKWIWFALSINGHINKTHLDCAIGKTSQSLLLFSPPGSQFPSLHSYFGFLQVILFRLWLVSDFWSAPNSTQPSSQFSIKMFPEHRLLLVWLGDNFFLHTFAAL